MKNIVKSFTAIAMLLLCTNVFQSCLGNDGLCYANMDFIITENEKCELGQYVGFELKFVDKQGNEMIKPYVIPASVQSHVIALPPNRGYDVYIRNNGVQGDCGGPVYFDIVISDPDDDNECFRISVSADGRTGLWADPLVSFDLGETCDECPTISAE